MNTRLFKGLWLVLILALALPVHAQGNDPYTEVLTYIRENPDKVGIACQVLGEADDVYFHNADENFVLASTGKIIILAAYAERVANGELDPETSIHIDDLDPYYLPLTDGGAHAQWTLSLDLGDDGMITLHDIVTGMIRFSSNANTDYLLDLMGYPDFADIYAAFGVNDMGQFPPLLGLYLLAFDPAVDRDAITDATAEAIDAAEAYIASPEIREQALEIYEDVDLDLGGDFLRQYFWQGTPRDFAHIMAQVAEGKGVSEDAAAIMRDVLEWPMSAQPDNADYFSVLATKGGSLLNPGTLTGAWYGASLDGPTVAVSVFYNDLESETFNQWVSHFAHQLIEVSPIIDGSCLEFEQLFVEAE